MRRNAVLALTGLMLGVATACSSGTGAGGTGGAPGTGGILGTGGGTATGGAGTGGVVGTGGVAGGTGGAAVGTGGVAGGAGGAAGKAGAGGNAGNAGNGGGIAGAGGGATGGAAGKGGAGGAGGASPCQAVLALDRTCTIDADCFAGVHQTNCCGTQKYIGFRTSAQAQYQDLEPKCDATYPACGCAELQPTTDDGSAIQFGKTPGVTCLQGICTTFVPDCGKPCASGTTCFSCIARNTMFAACTTMCTGNNQCTDSTLPLCQTGSSGNTWGTFCTASNVACDTK